jgi:hypothetical protein
MRASHGQVRIAPPWPKLPLSRLKSVELTMPSRLKSARRSVEPPKALRRMLKSVELMMLVLLASPALISPISWFDTPALMEREPAVARLIVPFTLQLYTPSGRLVVTVKKPEASVDMG